MKHIYERKKKCGTVVYDVEMKRKLFTFKKRFSSLETAQECVKALIDQYDSVKDRQALLESRLRIAEMKILSDDHSDGVSTS